VKEECKRRMQEQWGYEGRTKHRYVQYAQVHLEMLGKVATDCELKFYDGIKDSKSSVIGQMTKKYGEGSRQFCFRHPETGDAILLSDDKKQSELRSWAREMMYFGFGNVAKDADGEFVWDQPVLNRGKQQII